MKSVIYGYARVSTDDQDLALQKTALEKFGVDHIIEEHASGKTMNRGRFKALAENLLRPGDTLVIWKLDRLGRNLSGVLQVIEEFKRQDIKLVSITEGFDARTPMGNAMMQISLVFAELERNLISERTKAGMAAAKAEGKVFGRRHYIRDFPKRIKYLRDLNDKGELISEDGMLLKTPKVLAELLNKVDPKAPQIENPETIRRWKRDGFPWLKDEEGQDG